jgi:hypothetical protein
MANEKKITLCHVLWLLLFRVSPNSGPYRPQALRIQFKLPTVPVMMTQIAHLASSDRPLRLTASSAVTVGFRPVGRKAHNATPTVTCSTASEFRRRRRGD